MCCHTMPCLTAFPAALFPTVYREFSSTWHEGEAALMMSALSVSAARQYFEVLVVIKYMLAFTIVCYLLAIGYSLVWQTLPVSRRWNFAGVFLLTTIMIVWQQGKPKIHIVLGAGRVLTTHPGGMFWFVVVCSTFCIFCLTIDEIGVILAGKPREGVIVAFGYLLWRKGKRLKQLPAYVRLLCSRWFQTRDYGAETKKEVPVCMQGATAPSQESITASSMTASSESKSVP
jgi:hypothetical protein